MEKYFLFALRSDFHSDFETIYEKVVSSYSLSLDMFFSLVGKLSSCFSSCSVDCLDSVDSPYMRKIRVSSGETKIYVYLQKLS